MLRMDLGELARAAEAQIIGGVLPIEVTAVSTDTRTLPSSALFVALRGENFDGHDFIETAVHKGAQALLVEEESSAAHSVPQLLVEDSLKSMGRMATQVRSHLDGPVVAVTGSNGKTSTKEMIAALMATRFEVLSTKGNYNNLIGLPLTLFGLEESHEAAVLEMGMNVPGEIEALTEIARPTIGVITNVAGAHLEGLGSLEAVAQAKGELFASLSDNAIAVINTDDPLVNTICRGYLKAQQQITFGGSQECDVRIVGVDTDAKGTKVSMEIQGEAFDFVLPLVGRHHGHNAAAAAAVGLACGLSAKEIAEGLTKVALPGGRFKILSVEPRGWTLIDDTYNANPASMHAAFETFADLPAQRRIAVLGDMYELGAETKAAHAGVGQDAVEHGVDVVIAVGEYHMDTISGLDSAAADAHGFSTNEEAIEFLEGILKSGDWVLVKGSRGMRMETIVNALSGGQD